MRTLLIVSLAAFTASAVAQNQTHYSSPRGLLTIDGNSEATHFGGFSNARYMFFDGEQRNSVIVVREVAYRLDQRIYSSTSGAGRSWSAVTLNASDCYINEATTTFSENQVSKPTQVFSGKVTWPSITSRPASNPATWGGAKGAYRFPFSTAWISVGRRDICLDYDFSGGSLENGAA